MSELMTRDDYIALLASKYDVAHGEIVEAVDAALASNHVRRWGWLSEGTIATAWENGEKPSPGPYELRYRPHWLERNTYELIKYSTHDLDLKTREARKNWRTVKKRRAPSRSVEEGLAIVRPEAERRRAAGKPLTTGVRPSLRRLGFHDQEISKVINVLQNEGLVRKRAEGRPIKTTT